MMNKKLLFLVGLSLFAFMSASAQSWMLYNASVLPSETGGATLDLTSLSQDSPGPNFEEVLEYDPIIPGNQVLRYVQPDTSATKMYRTYLTNGGTNMTLVARLKGLPNWQELGLERVFDLQYRNGNAGARDALRIQYSDSSIYLDRSNSPSVQPGIDVTEWHIYRIAIYGDSSVVYVDEDPNSVLTGISTSSTSDTYIKIGDGSGDKVGGLVDWVALDTTGAYSPTESPLDSTLFTGVGTPQTLGDIVFLTQRIWRDASETYGDSLYVVNLHNAGYHVEVPPYSDYTTVDSAEAEVLKAADLVVIGRGVSSGDFDDADDVIWEELETPIILMSNYVARNNRLRWFNSSSALSAARFGTLQANVEQTADTAFTGVSVSGGVIDYGTDNLGFIHVPDRNTIYGEVLLTITNGPEAYLVNTGDGSITDTIQLSDYDGNVLMARFAPGDTMYRGGGAVPAGWRTFMTAGDDQDYDSTVSRRVFNFYIYSDAMNQVFLNEVDYLIRGPQRDPSVNVTQPIGQALAVEVFPNPFENNWNLRLNLDRRETAHLSIYSMEGRLVKRYEPRALNAGENEIRMDGQGLKPGMYIYQVVVGQQVAAGKIRKQ